MQSFLSESAALCAAEIAKARHLVLLSGAGMSTGAGIPDFRGPDGLYRRLGIRNPERIFDIDVFRSDPSFFYGFHKEFLRQVEAVTPTFAHRFFARLEQMGRLDGIVTQNIDALHQKAGSAKVLEIHGSIWESHCTGCGRRFSYGEALRKVESETVPLCERCQSVIKPDVVFFGENVMEFEACQELVAGSDLLFIVGSSLAVTPAAWLPSQCQGRIIVVNRGEISKAYLPAYRVALHVEEDIDTFFEALAHEMGIKPEGAAPAPSP